MSERESEAEEEVAGRGALRVADWGMGRTPEMPWRERVEIRWFSELPGTSQQTRMPGGEGCRV